MMGSPGDDDGAVVLVGAAEEGQSGGAGVGSGAGGEFGDGVGVVAGVGVGTGAWVRDGSGPGGWMGAACVVSGGW